MLISSIGTERQVEMRLFENDTKEIMAAKGVNGLCTLMYVPLRQPVSEDAAAANTWTLAVSVLAPGKSMNQSGIGAVL